MPRILSRHSRARRSAKSVVSSSRQNATLLDTIAAPNMPLTLCVVSATSLRPMRKGYTSNPMCEISLVTADGERQGKPFRTPVVRSALNPIWNFNVDFGDVDPTAIAGVLFTVRHVAKFGMVKKDIGQVLVPMHELAKMRMEALQEKTYTMQATEESATKAIDEGPAKRMLGKITVRFNSYGLARRTDPVDDSISMDRNSLMASSGFGRNVTHEDDFALGTPRKPILHDAQEEVRKLQACHQELPRAGELWYAIDARWVSRWLLFVSKHKCQERYNPGPIDNESLLMDDLRDGRFHLRRSLTVKKDFRMINKASWDFFQAHYGGGPAIEVYVPKSCADTSRWMAELQLHRDAQVGSTYLSTCSDVEY